ncbi:MAG: hypothetical protein PW843_27910 [Azospirillaceae bacterium]|nr:hypothetical protein [Azospirillaceae bacterium]
MDQALIKQTSIALEDLLKIYAKNDPEAQSLFGALKPIIDDAKAGKIQSPMDWGDVPGGWFFMEGTLRKYRDLESAFSKFQIEVTGGETPDVKAALQAIRAMRANKP